MPAGASCKAAIVLTNLLIIMHAQSNQRVPARPAVTFSHGNGPRLSRLAGNFVEPRLRVPTDVVLKDGSTPARQYAGGIQHWSDPIVHTWDGVLSIAECETIIQIARPSMTRGNVTDGTRTGRQSPTRTNDVAFLP